MAPIIFTGGLNRGQREKRYLNRNSWWKEVSTCTKEGIEKVKNLKFSIWAKRRILFLLITLLLACIAMIIFDYTKIIASIIGTNLFLIICILTLVFEDSETSQPCNV